MAITGGVSLMPTQDFTTHLNNLNFLKPEGRSKAFDESAGGYGRGEGCGIIILKRLADAIQEGDDIRAVIRAVIRATGANSDGFTQVGKYTLVSTAQYRAHVSPKLNQELLTLLFAGSCRLWKHRLHS